MSDRNCETSGKRARCHVRDERLNQIQAQELIAHTNRNTEAECESRIGRAAQTNSAPPRPTPPEKHRRDNKQDGSRAERNVTKKPCDDDERSK